MKKTIFGVPTSAFAILTLIAVMAIASAVGYPLYQFVPHDVLAGLGAMSAMPMIVGDTGSFVEVKKILEDQGRTWDEYKKTNDERLSRIEKGQSTADLDVKLSKMDEGMKELSDELKQISLKASRPQLSADAEAKSALSLKDFNAKSQAAAMETGKAFTPLTAEGYDAYKSAVSRFIRVGVDKLTPDEQKAINVGTASQGGFLIGSEMESGIDRVVGRYSSMRQLARVIPIGQASYKKLVKTSGTTGGSRGGETSAPAQGSSSNWSELEFKTGTYLSDQRITMESLEDAVQDVEGDLTEEIGIEFAEMEGQDFMTGDGVNGPRGIFAYDPVANVSYQWGKVGYVASGGASGFAASNPSDRLIDLQHSLKRQYRANGVWSMNDATLAAIRKFKDGNGIYLWAPSGLLQGVAGQLLGHAVVTDDFMPDLGSNTFPIAFGDFKRAYYVIDRKGISILRDPYTAVPYIKFVARKRVGGGIANFEALKLLKCEA
jgi:HK97 family phage major capsid protein